MDAHTGTITLQPYTSEILIKTSSQITANAGSDEEICLGESVTLTATGGATYFWNTGATTQSITVSPNETTTYLTGTDSEGKNQLIVLW